MQKEQFYNLLANPGLLNIETLAGLKTIVDEFPYFQAALVLYLKNLKETDNPDFEHVLKKTAIRFSDRKKLYEFLNSKPTIENANPALGNTEAPFPELQLEEEQNKPGNSLIDRFLMSDSTAIKRRTENQGEVENSIENEIVKKSDAENDEIITETLATIYFQQKKYDKALEAFSKLSLKYPEKSVYFATRIKEIDKIKNV